MDLLRLRAWGVRVANCEGCGPEDLCQVHYNELVELLLWDDVGDGQERCEAAAYEPLPWIDSSIGYEG